MDKGRGKKEWQHRSAQGQATQPRGWDPTSATAAPQRRWRDSPRHGENEATPPALHAPPPPLLYSSPPHWITIPPINPSPAQPPQPPNKKSSPQVPTPPPSSAPITSYHPHPPTHPPTHPIHHLFQVTFSLRYYARNSLLHGNPITSFLALISPYHALLACTLLLGLPLNLHFDYTKIALGLYLNLHLNLHFDYTLG
jgi:hypothetical protein